MQRTLSCIGRGVVRATNYRASSIGVGEIIFNNGDPLPLRGGEYPLSIFVSQQYRVVERADLPRTARWQCKITGYWFHVLGRERDRDVDLFGYHWHPAAREAEHIDPATPHLHMWSPLLADPYLTFAKKHFPTDHVYIEDLLLLLIGEFGIQAAANWRTILAQRKPNRL